MKFVLPLVVLTAGVAGMYLIGSGRSVTSTPRPVALAAVPIRADDNARLTAQVEALQREVAALKSQAAPARSQPHPSGAGTSGSVEIPKDLAATKAERAAEAEQHRAYMASVAQSFADEKIDIKWAGYAASRLAATLEDDDVLRAAAHEVECRQQTCRLRIEDDGTGRLSQRLTMMSLHIMDVFPTTAAELVDQGNGRNALVLYMSSQPSAPPPGPAK